MPFELPSEELRCELDKMAANYNEDGNIHTYGDGETDNCVKWMCASYGNNDHQLSIYGLTARQAATLVASVETMGLALKHSKQHRRD